ncbi:MAG: XdhC family protein [Chloroflexi bacterium]|nr:XdhC family protein [Chloroflexota bacterium]
MKDIFSEARRLHSAREPFVLATLVRTQGSTPQKPGAKLLVRPDGTIVGTLGGGCVEAEVWQESKQVLEQGGQPAVRRFVLSDELAAESGMVCGGTMDILIDPVLQGRPLLEHAGEVLSALDGGPAVAIASRIAGGALGASLLVREDGTRLGSLGDEGLDRLAAKHARELMAYGRCALVKAEAGEELFVESFTSPPQLVVAGAGHIAKALAPLAKSLGFQVVIADDRSEYANRERFPQADEIYVTHLVDAIKSMRITPNTAIVVATRGHKLDDVALLEAARSPAGFVGLVGSQRKTLLIYEHLLQEGVPFERLEQVHAPVGLDVGARTPEEIALSIMAEVEMVRLGGSGRPLKLPGKLLQKALEKAGQKVKSPSLG